MTYLWESPMDLLRRYVVLVVAMLICAQAHAELRILTEPGPPTAFMKDGELHGFGVDVVRQLITRTGGHAQIEMMPWTRAYTIAQREPDVGLFAMVRTPDREKRFQWVGPLLHGKVRFYSLKSNGLQVNTLEDVAASGPLAVPKQWYSYEVLKAQGLSNLYGVPSPRHMLNMFKHGRLRVLVANSATLRGMLAEHGMTPEEVELQFSFMPSDSYIAFSRSTSPALVARWQAQLQAMKDDGSLAAIAERWVGGEPPRGGRTTP